MFNLKQLLLNYYIKGHLLLQIIYLELSFFLQYGFLISSLFKQQFYYFNCPHRLTDQRRIVLSEWLISDEFKKLSQEIKDKFQSDNDDQRDKIIHNFVWFLNQKSAIDGWEHCINVVNHNLVKSNFNARFIDHYALILKKIINHFAQNGNKNLIIISFGAAAGEHERLVSVKLKSFLKKNDISLKWLGADIYEHEDNFFKEKNNDFVLIKPIKAEDHWKSFVNKFLSDEKYKVIINLIGVIHHMELDVPALIKFTRGADAVLVYDEPILKKNKHDFWIYSLQLAYDVLANISFQNDWTKEILKDSKNFKAKYLIKEDLADFFDLYLLPERSPMSFFGTLIK